MRKLLFSIAAVSAVATTAAFAADQSLKAPSCEYVRSEVARLEQRPGKKDREVAASMRANRANCFEQQTYYKAPPATVGTPWVPAVFTVYGGLVGGVVDKPSKGETVATSSHTLGTQNIGRSYAQFGIQGGAEAYVYGPVFVGVEGRALWGLGSDHVNAGIVAESSKLNTWGIDGILGVDLTRVGLTDVRLAGLIGYASNTARYNQLYLGNQFSGKASKDGAEFGLRVEKLWLDRTVATSFTWRYQNLDQVQAVGLPKVEVNDNSFMLSASYRKSIF